MRLKELVSAANDRDWKDVGNLYTEDAVHTGPTGMPFKGRQGETKYLFYIYSICLLTEVS